MTEKKKLSIDDLIVKGTTQAMKNKQPFGYIEKLGSQMQKLSGADKEKLTTKGINEYSNVYNQLLQCKNPKTSKYSLRKFSLVQGAKVMYNAVLKYLGVE